MPDRRTYLHLNPFLSNAVPEEAFWQADAVFPDVGRIHGRESARLRGELDELLGSPGHDSRLMFVVGGPGSGKSHLFSRLRRTLTHGEVFAFAANPPTRPSAIEGWILERVVHGMCRTLGRRFTQLQGFLYALVLSGTREAPRADLDQLHDYWHGVSARSRQNYLARLKSRLSDAGHWDPVLLPVLLDVLDPEKEDAAVAWLSGATSLSDEHLAVIGQGGPNDRILSTLLTLGQLAGIAARPIVLVLDQLDQMLTREHVAEFDRLLIALYDNSRGWFITVGLTREIYDVWRTHLSTPFVDRFLTGADAVVGLDPIGPTDKQAIVETRLEAPALVAQRAADGLPRGLFPFSDGMVADAVTAAGDYPRSVIIRARERYRAACMDADPLPVAIPLDDLVAREFEDARSRVDATSLTVDQAVLADRLAEAVEVVCLAAGRTCVRAVGDLEGLPRFRGTDTALTIDGTTVRLVGHHVQQGRQFPDFLRLVRGLPPPVVLVRDGVVAAAGKRTLEYLAEFRRDKTFLHLARESTADAYALGDLLASIREGNLDDAAATPNPTRALLFAATGRIDRVRQHPVVSAVMDSLAHADRVAHPQRPEAAPAASTAVAPTYVVAEAGDIIVEQAVATIMRRERWLVLDRLRRELARTAGLRVQTSRLRGILSRDPLRAQLTFHPGDVMQQADVHILIWAGD